MTLDRLTKVDGGGISTTSDYRVGIITASKFVGPFDGTGGNFSGVVTATNGVFSGNITAVDGNFSGNVTIGGTLTYEDVTNIDSVGLITARNGLIVTGVSTFQDIDVDGHTNLDNVSIAGLTTMSDDLRVDGNIRVQASSGYGFVKVFDGNTSSGGSLIVGTHSDLRIYHGGHNYYDAYNNARHLFMFNGSEVACSMTPNNKVSLMYAGVAKFETATSGVNIVGTTTSTQLAITGVSTFTGAIDANGDLDVDGHTELDNVNITGVTSTAAINVGGILDVRSTFPQIRLTDTNHNDDFHILNEHGEFKIRDATNTVDRIIINSVGVTTFSSTTNFNQGVNVSGDLDVDGHTNLDNVSIAGVTTFASDVGIAQSIFHYNDTDTTIGFPAANQIKIHTGGVERFLITNSYNWSKNTTYVNTTNESNDNAIFLVRNNTQSYHTIWESQNTNARSTIFQWNDYGNSGTAGNLIFRSRNSPYEEHARFTGAGNFNLLKDLDVDGHTNLDNVSVAGISTFSNSLFLPDDQQVKLGNTAASPDFKIFHDSTANNNVIEGHLNSLNLRNYNVNCTDIVLSARRNIILQTNLNETAIQCLVNGATEIFHDGGTYTTPKFRTTTTGIQVLGEVAASQDYPNFRPTLDFNFAATKKLDPRITYYRTGPASYHDEFGKVVIVGENVPRFDHTFPEYWDEGNLGDSNSRGISKGLLMEPTRTNLYKNNHNLTTTNDHGSITQTVNTTETTAPDGTLTATKIAVTGSDQWSRWDGNNGLDLVGVNFTDTFSTSIYMKTVGTSNVNVAMDFGDNGTKTFSVGQEWKRYAISNVHHNYGGSTKFIDIIFSGSVYIWGLQCENGTHPTSYIPTSGTTATRGNEYAVIDGEDFTDFYNPVESSVLAVGTIHRPIAAQGQLNIFHIGDDNEDGHGVFREHGTKDVWYHIRNGNSTPSGGNLNPSGFGDWDENEEARIAIAFKDGDQAISVNGGNQVTATVTSNYPTANITKMWIGSHGTGSYFEGTISRIAYYPKQLTDNQLNTLTA